MQDNKMHQQQPPRNYSAEELCCTVFYMTRYAEALEADKAISVENERELFLLILDWAKEFEQSFDCYSKDYSTELESRGFRWLLETFPYSPELDDDLDGDNGMEMSTHGM